MKLFRFFWRYSSNLFFPHPSIMTRCNGGFTWLVRFSLRFCFCANFFIDYGFWLLLCCRCDCATKFLNLFRLGRGPAAWILAWDNFSCVVRWQLNAHDRVHAKCLCWTDARLFTNCMGGESVSFGHATVLVHWTMWLWRHVLFSW